MAAFDLPSDLAVRTHREVAAHLVLRGWIPGGVGDWALALRSPDGTSVARVCPFDPAYAAFVELCRRCPDSPYLPRVLLHADLDGGATLTVLEFLAPLDPAQAADVARRWADGDPAFQDVRQAALAVDAEWRASMPWWDGIDLNAGNVRRGLDGRTVLIDVFCMDGESLYGQVMKDASVVRERLPRSRHLLEIPYIARESAPEEIRALREAWEAGRP
ncbi:hypothetical protein [Nonomuraea sp. NPDC050310]|uniref:hypothetical protein n=1 Tax=Nonomuraea sp. NPDC050310 TaxID=3154935 RepID=UPI0033DD1306